MSGSHDQLPETTDLTPEQLKAAYSGTNQQRFDFFDLYAYFYKHAPDMKLALLIFEFEFIDQTYKTMSPEKKVGWFWSSGSEVYSVLHKFLGEVSIEKRLTEINHLRRYVEKQLAFDAVVCKTWPNREALLQTIEQVEEKIVKVKEKLKINKLLHTMPDLVALRNNIKAISDSYHSAKSGKSENIKREGALTFIDFVATTCNEVYGETYKDKTRDENEKDAAYSNAYNTHKGMILFALLQVQDEYSGWFLSPHRSALFRECLMALGYSSLKEITLEDKIEWLRALSGHLTTVRNVTYKGKATPNKTAYEALLELWKDRKLPDLDQTKLDIETKIFQFEQEKTQPSFIVSTAKSATSSLAAYGVQRTIAVYLAQYALVPAVTATLSGMLTGPVGMVLGGLVGPFIANRIGRLVSEKLIPTAVGNLCATILDRITTKLGEAAAAAAFTLFAVSANGMQKLLGFYKEHVTEDFDPEWVNTLLDLPDRMVSAQDKQKIRKVRGLPDPQFKAGEAQPTVLGRAPLMFFDNYEGKAASQSAPLVPAAALSLIN